MKHLTCGWVIYTPAFKFTGGPQILEWTYSALRKDAIAKVGNAKEWRIYRLKFNYICVRADCAITIEK